MSDCFNSRLIGGAGWAATAIVLGCGACAFGQLSLSDGNAVFSYGTFPTQATGSPATADFRPNTSPDFLYSNWWHYRRAADTREYAMANPVVTPIGPNAAELLFNAGDFTWKINHTLADGPVLNWADLRMDWTVEASPSGDVDVQLIGYVDADVVFDSDRAHRIPSTYLSGSLHTNGIQLSNGNLIVNYRSSFAEAGDYRVAAYSAVADQLMDNGVTAFDNSGLPFGPADFTGALSYHLNLPAGQSFQTDRIIEIRPVETISWNASTAADLVDSASWSASTGDGSTAPQTWRIANLDNAGAEPLRSAYLDSAATAVVRQMNVNTHGGTQPMSVEIGTGAFLGVITNAAIGNQGILEMQAGTFYASSLEIEAGGTLVGNGELILNEPLVNAGRVSPGLSAGSLTISDGDYVQQAGGQLDIELGGTAVSQHDLLDIAGSAHFDGGTLNISLIAPFVPVAGDAFEIIRYGSYGGANFDDITGDYLGQGLFLKPVFSAIDLTLLATQAGPGDTNLDGDVDLSDLGNLATSYGGTSGLDWINGDFDHDGDVDLSDLGTLATYYGAGSAQAFADFQMLISVPEPGGAALVILASAGCFHRRRPPRRREAAA